MSPPPASSVHTPPTRLTCRNNLRVALHWRCAIVFVISAYVGPINGSMGNVTSVISLDARLKYPIAASPNSDLIYNGMLSRANKLTVPLMLVLNANFVMDFQSG